LRAVISSSRSEGDLYLLKFIMHDWNDEECVTVCVDAVRRWRRGRVAIIELVVESDNPIAALWDMPMLGVCTGRERSLDEFEVLLAAGGLRLSAVRQTSTPQLVIEAALDA
jgi:hypothetical protein